MKFKSPVVLLRKSLAEEKELEICSSYFDVIQFRSMINEKNDLVIPRYSALPFYQELQTDVEYLGSKLLNTYRQHQYVAKISNWYYDLSQLTPRTWFHLDQIPNNTSFVLKGETNSKKHAWNTMMFAENKQKAIETYIRLSGDSLIGTQDICIREYVPLRKLADGINGLPISEEYRFFVLFGEIVGKGFYWSNHWDDFEEKPNVEDVPKDLIKNIIDIVSPSINGFVFDVARTVDGSWILIELNDLQCSGLSMVDPNVLYKNMRKILI